MSTKGKIGRAVYQCTCARSTPRWGGGRVAKATAAEANACAWRLRSLRAGDCAPPPPRPSSPPLEAAEAPPCVAPPEARAGSLYCSAPHPTRWAGSGHACPGCVLPPSNCIAGPSPSLPPTARTRPGLASCGALAPTALQRALLPPRGAGSRAVAHRLAESWVRRPALRPSLRAPPQQRGEVLTETGPA